MLKKWMQLLAMVLVLCLACGCEDDDPAFDYGDNDPNVWVALGDSITEGLSEAGTPYPTRLASLTGKTVLNMGYGGHHSDEGAARVGGILAKYKPGRLMVLYGANDLLHDYSKNDTVEALRYIVQQAKANKTDVIIGTLLPMPGHQGLYDGGTDALSAQIRTMAAEEGVRVADFDAMCGTGDGLMLGDGVHPNSAGNDLLASGFR